MSTNLNAGTVVIDRLDLDSDGKAFEGIAAIQAELATAFELLAAGEHESSTGFLISAYKAEDFRDFIRRGGFILAAHLAERGALIGYLLANSGATFLANHPATTLLWDDETSRRTHGPAYASGNFTYLDQIGVTRSLHGTGVARDLHRRFLELVPTPILAAVVQEPIRNTRSTVFFKKLGYRQIGMFHTAELKGLRDVRSAVLALAAAGPSP
jgi:predicted GNAT superfamily acetyltransferase